MRRDDDVSLFGQKVRYGKIAFARVVVEAEHPASRWEFRQFLGNGRKSRARRNANQHSFFVCRTQRHFLCIGGFDQNGAVKQLGVQIGWNERSEEQTSEPQSIMRITYAVFCLKNKNI